MVFIGRKYNILMTFLFRILDKEVLPEMFAEIADILAKYSHRDEIEIYQF